MSATDFAAREARRRAPAAACRFEYRVWPGRPHPAVARLQSGWRPAGAERRSDVYLVTASSDRVVVKLRHGLRLEVKRRGEDDGPLQRWTPELSRRFPLAAADLGRVTEALRLRRRLPGEAALSPAHLLAELEVRGAPVTARAVGKSRLLFGSEACRAEICRVSLGDWTATTVALEGRERAAVAEAVAALGLAVLPNRSYGEALIRLAAPRSERRGLPAGACAQDGPTR